MNSQINPTVSRNSDLREEQKKIHRTEIMRYIFIITISLILASCGASQEDKNIAAEKQAEENRIAEEKQRISDAKPSVTETFHTNGKLKSRTNYQSINDGGKRNGLWETYRENGQLYDKANFKDGELHGLWETHNENGQLNRKGNWKDGKRHGLKEHYYENGQLKRKENYKDGELHGLRENYDENGQLLMKINYKDGKKDGLSALYRENRFTIYLCYKNGEVTDKSYCKPQ